MREWTWHDLVMRCAVAGALAGCGRIAFDPQGGGAPGSDGGGDSSGAASDGAIPDEVVAYRMDDMIAGGVVPATVAGYDGACAAGQCPTLVAGRIGGGYAFGAAHSITLPAPSAGLAGPQPFTIALWMAPTPGTGDLALVAKPYSAASSSNAVALAIPAGTRYLTFETTPDGAIFEYLNTPAAIDIGDGAWHHVGLSWNGTAKRIYLDGVLVGTAVATVATSAEPIVLGLDLDDGVAVHHYMGALDDLRFYARALSDAEIAALAGS